MARVLGACVVGWVLMACDPGNPSASEQMASLGLPVDSALQVDEETVVTVQIQSGVPELLIYTPTPFGGDQVSPWPADSGSIGDGAYGSATSSAPYNPQRGERKFTYCYNFGAGQGPIDEIVLSDPAARWQIVNPAIDGWVVVMTDENDVAALEWQLIGTGGTVLHSGRGFPGSSCGAG